MSSIAATRSGSVLAQTLFIGGAVLLSGLATAQQKKLSLEEIYSPDREARVDFDGSPPQVRWLDEARYLERAEGESEPWYVVDAKSGERRVFFGSAAMEKALLELPGIADEDAKALSLSTSLELTEDGQSLLLNHANDLFVYDLEKERAARITHDPDPEVGAEWSPDRRFVSFVRGHDVYLVDVGSGRERRLTEGGNSELLYGRLDWVYQEEIYGRGNFKGYWWSPDSSHIALLRLDESPVREFTVIDHIPTELEREVTNYPKAGSPNPKVALGVIPAAGGETVWLDTRRWEPIEHLIVRVAWHPDGERLYFQLQDREQRWLELISADPATGETEVVLREESPAFVQVNGEPIWLDDGTFLWLSERSGFKHLYHYEANGELLRQLTRGEWEIANVEGVDENGGRVYFSGTADGPTEQHVYRVSLTGGDIERLTERAGTHVATFSPGRDFWFDSFSDVRTPPELSLRSSSGATIRTLAESAETLGDYRLGSVEFLRVDTRDGFPMEAMVIKPPDFDPAKRHPVLQYNYGGPHSPVVKNRWGGSRYLWHQMLAQEGYVIWMCDNRSASGKGIAPTWEAYRRMGVIELRDIEDGVAWLKKQSWVDPERIGIWGWSYGGFMASYALTHSESFRMGIAGAPVTDWRLYDTVYTERYMTMPQNNEEGYDETSVVQAAENLHGKLLLIHGTMDDNVHLQNTVQFVYELQKAGKDFEMMIYPKSRHGVRDEDLALHLQRLMTDFVRRTL